MHEKTRALLEAAKAYGPVDVENDGKKTTVLLDSALDWWYVGCPDLDAPEPVTQAPTYEARFAEMEGRIKTLFELAGSRRQDSDDQLAQVTELEARLGAVSNWVKTLNEQHALHATELSEHRTSTASAIMRLTDQIKALEPRPAPPPDPARFVPTEPGWYWARLTDGQPAVRWYSGTGTYAVPMEWLAPVAPYAPPTRTEEEARREPRRGDRWRSGDNWYTLGEKSPHTGFIRVVWNTGAPGAYEVSDIGEPGETYLGNFAHELEAP